MRRRELLTAAVVVAVGGCLSEPEAATSAEDNGATDAEREGREVLRENDVVVQDTRLPHQFEGGDEIVVEVRVDRGGPVWVLIDEIDGDSLAEKEVRTEETVRTTAPSTGDYEIWILGEGTSYVTVARE